MTLKSFTNQQIAYKLMLGNILQFVGNPNLSSIIYA